MSKENLNVSRENIIPAFPEKYIELQIREIEMRRQEIELRKKREENNHEYAKES